MRIKKRGLSGVVATALLLLITISAVVIAANFIIPFVNKSLESTSCFKFRDYFSFEEGDGFNCHNQESIYSMSVKTRTDDKDADKIKGFIIRFKNNVTTESINVTDGASSTATFKMFEEVEEVGKLVIPKAGGDYSLLSYNYNSNVNYTIAEIYPILNGKICDMSDSIKLNNC